MLTTLVLGSLLGLTSAPPVEIAKCDVWSPVPQDQGDGAPTPSGAFTLHVRFSNSAQQPISRVTFTLNDGTTVSDVGTFSPGVTIDHALALKETQAESCSVTAVQFADGGTWTAN